MTVFWIGISGVVVTFIAGVMVIVGGWIKQ